MSTIDDIARNSDTFRILSPERAIIEEITALFHGSAAGRTRRALTNAPSAQLKAKG